jgi:cytidylate kinase
MKKIIIAIDGNSGCGKSSTAKAIAKELQYVYIDTGAMYRAVTYFFIKNDIDLHNEKDVAEALKQIDISFEYNVSTSKNETYLNGKNVEYQIRQMEVSNQVSPVSEISAVRRKLVEQQRRMGQNKGLVMDGRDIGTVVFPDAELKIYMTASLEVRAERRKLELEEKGVEVNLKEVIENLSNRDKIDSSRKDSPLKKAENAVEIDTSNLTFDEQVNKILVLVNKLLG